MTFFSSLSCGRAAAIGTSVFWLFFAFLAGPAAARPEMSNENVHQRFHAMDSDKDGRVCRNEFFDAHPQMKDAAFDAIDTDKDSCLSPQEWRDFAVDHGKSDPHAGGMGAMGGGGKQPIADPEGGETAPEAAQSKSGTGGQDKAPDLIMPPKDGK